MIIPSPPVINDLNLTLPNARKYVKKYRSGNGNIRYFAKKSPLNDIKLHDSVNSTEIRYNLACTNSTG